MIRHAFHTVLIGALLAGAAGCNGKSTSSSAGAPVVDAATADGPEGNGRTITRLVTGLGSPSSLSVDSQYAYVAPADEGGNVMRVPLDGGPATLLASSPSPNSLTIDGANVYWTDDDPDGGSVLSIPTHGGAVTTLAGNLPAPGPIAVLGGTVYWANLGASGQPCDAGCAPSVASVATAGGAVSTLYTAPAQSFPDGIVAHGASVYLSTSDGRIVDIPDDGGASKLLRYEVTSNQGIAADDTYVYWVDTAGNVMRLSLDGGTPTVLAYSQQAGSIAVDSTGVYWSNGGDGTVMTVPVSGGTPSTLVSGLSYPSGIALGSSSVYWFNGQGELWVASPK